MRYKVIISAQINVEADSKEEAEQKAILKYKEKENFKIEQDPTNKHYGEYYHNILEFDAILDDIQDEITEQEIVDEVKQYRKDKFKKELALEKIELEYNDPKSAHYRDNERYSWAVAHINKQYENEEMNSLDTKL